MTRSLVVFALALILSASVAPALDAQLPIPFGRKPPPTGTAQVSGRVVADDTGRPLRGVTVKLAAPEVSHRDIAITDADGRFTFRQLPAGRYALGSTKAGFAPAQYGARRAFEGGKYLQITDAQRVTDIEMRMLRSGAISGRVVDEFGDPVAESTVQAMRVQYVGGRHRLVPTARTAVTNDLGDYRIFGLPEGDYYISTKVRFFGLLPGEGDEAASYAPSYYPGTAAPAQAQRVRLKGGGETNGINLVLFATRTSRITGTVTTTSPLGLSRVMLMLTERQASGITALGGSGTLAASDGSFSIGSVPPGEYVLQARTAGMGEAQYGSTLVTVNGANVEGVAISLGPTATATGTITFDGAEPPVPPTLLRLQSHAIDDAGPSAPTVAKATIADDWTFELKGLAGPSLLRATSLPPGWTLKSVTVGGDDVTDQPTDFRSRAEGGKVEGVAVVITRVTPTVTGTYADAKGKPIADASIILFSDDPARWGFQSRFVQAVRTDENGAFKAQGLIAGGYLVAVAEEEDGAWTDPLVLERLRPTATRVTLTAQGQHTVTLKAR